MFVYVKNMWIDLEDVFCVCVGWTVTKHIVFVLFGGWMSFTGERVGEWVGVWGCGSAFWLV